MSLRQPDGKIVGTREILIEFQELRAKLEEAEATLDAIRSGEVDALIVEGANGQQVYTLTGANDNFRTFVERMQEGAATLDSNGVVLYANQSLADMAGKSLEIVIGRNFEHLVHPSHRKEFCQVLAHAQVGVERFESLISGPLEDVPVQLSISPLDGNDNSAFALTATNLSIQKRHERDLQKANAELQGFCYSISHDLRTPLRSIVSAAAIVLEDHESEIPAAATKELLRIKAAGNHLGLLIDDLLTYARLERHKLKAESIDLTKMVTEILSEIDGADRVKWTIQPSLTTVGDPSLLQVLLQNLISNAVKYSATRQEPAITIGEEVFPEGRAFFVCDNGIGFDMAYIDKIFVPFERLHTTSEYPGTGIGLANVQRVLVRHGGRVWADAALGRGATFYFSIPETAAVS